MTYLPNKDPRLIQAINVIFNDYGDVVSVEQKKKNLLKFGTRTTVGTGWETIMTAVGTETQETYETDNLIDSINSSYDLDNGKVVKVEYHTISGGNTTFGVQTVTLHPSYATSGVSLPTPAFRASRIYNVGLSALSGSIFVYKNNAGVRDDNKTHVVIPAGDQQTQKASTTISANDYWIVTRISISVLSKVTKYAEARLEIKPVTTSYWRPITQTISTTDSTGTVHIDLDPFAIVPANHDVRLAVRTNTSAVDVAGGFSGYLASVVA